jgi:phosphoglycerate dehydrogenase-like enzyme
VDVLISIFSSFAVWNIPDEFVQKLRERFPDVRFLHARNLAESLELAPSAEVAFAGELHRHTFAAARALRWVHSPAAGIGGMLYPALVTSPVVLTNSRGMHAETIAEHVIAVSLALLRQLPIAVRRQAERRWAQDELSLPPGIRRIAGLRVGLVGLGAIGLAVARVMSALGAEVHATRRRARADRPAFVASIVPSDRLHDLLRASDIVVLAAPQTNETRGLIGAAELAVMKADAILVNVARGRLVDEAALIAALQTGPPGAAALDVFEHEPLDPDSRLWTLPNVLLTPHVSGWRNDYWDAAIDLFSDNLRRYLAGEPLLNVVDKKAGY